MHCPGIFGSGEAELLNFLELVDAEDSPHVFPVCASFFTEAAAYTSEAQG